MSKYDSLFDKHGIPEIDRAVLADFCEKGEDTDGKVLTMLDRNKNYQAAVDGAFGEHVEALAALGRALKASEDSIESAPMINSTEIFDRHRIAEEDRQPLREFIAGTERGSISSMLEDKIENNRNYQAAIEETLAQIFKPFQDAIKRERERSQKGFGEIQ